MPVYSARDIYRFARMAGFSPGQAATMTAVALAESGGNSNAHNPRGENSRGLWQINVAAHKDLAGTNLFDPVENARAAYRISRGGQDISPWTTTHGGARAKYLSYRMEAEAAARASGDGSGLGVWTGTRGYGSPLSAGAAGGGTPFDATAYSAGASGATGFPAGGSSGTAADDFVRLALAQTGDRYVFGTEVDLDDPDPSVFDCSELTQWAAHQVGVELPEASYLQFQELQQEGGQISVEQALQTRGALLFSFSEPPTGSTRPSQAHVAISLGDGRTIEARGTKYGVGSWEANTKRFNYAAVIPQLSGPGTGLGTGAGPGFGAGVPAVPTPPVAPPVPDFGPAIDTDADGLIDGRETAMGSNPNAADTDADGISDAYEVVRLRTDPTKADSDGDRLGDAFELAQGFDPTNPDSDRDGSVDGAQGPQSDTDRDGLTDPLEQLLQSDPLSIDSDGDGLTDGLEYRSSLDPTDPFSSPGAAAGAGRNGFGDPLVGGGAGGLTGAGFPGGDGTGLTGDPTASLDDLGAP